MNKKRFFEKRRGFSVVELIIVFAIISILAAMGVAGFVYYKKGANISVAQEQVANAIRRAQAKSVSMAEDDGWGIDVQEKEAIIFKGSNFTSRNHSFDEKIPISGVKTVSGRTRIIFSKFTGIPQSFGTVTLSSGNSSKSIEINEKGIVSY